jgi:hypothetical protein
VTQEIELAQRALCAERNAEFLATPRTSKLGVAFATVGLRPVNGLRHPATSETNGWYIWCGEEFSSEPDFFAPLHASHLYDEHPDWGRLLGLAPGYRFLLDADYLDVWFDASLLNV